MTVKQADVLKELARVDGKEPFSAGFQKATGQPLGTIQKAVKKLEKEEIVYQPYDVDNYRFLDPFFQAWVIQEQGIELFASGNDDDFGPAPR